MSSAEDPRGDLRWGTTPRLLADAAARLGDAPALVDAADGTTLSFAALAAAARRAARAFLAAGVEPGDRVAMWATNGWHWVVAALGLQSAGGVLVPLNTRFKGREAAWVLQRSKARVLVAADRILGVDLVAMLRAAGEPLPDLETVVRLDGWEEFLARGDVISDESAAARAAAVAPGDLSDLQFTSGTTGQPKGVLCTHAQTLRVFATWSHLVGLRAGDRYLVVNPYFHTFGYKAGWLACLIVGAVNLPQAVFSAAEVLDRIARDRITVLPGPPTLYQTLLHHPDRAARDLSTLRLAVTGAAVIPVELVRRMRDELGFATVLTAYGLTECCGVATMCRDGDDAALIASTSGRAIPDTEVKVCDAAGVAVAAGHPGEVRVRGYHVTGGYLDEPDETARAFDEAGWLRTGDVGVMDEAGNLRITDRLKDLFIVGGFNAYPAEIERLLLTHPAVAQAAVIGVPDERLGEVGMAFVVLRPGAAAATTTADDLLEWSRREMANYKAPRHVLLVEELPLGPTGKVQKHRLREQAAAVRPRR